MKEVVLELAPRDLAYWDVAGHVWRAKRESVRISAGGSSDTLPVQATLQIETAAEYKP